MNKTLGWLGAIVLVTTQGMSPAMAQDYPKKHPIRIIAAANAGGGTDALARVTAEFLQRRLGQTVIVENRPGAAGSLGADFVAKSPADGYTLLFTANEFCVLPAVRNNLPYKFDEFTYLMRFFSMSPLLLGSPTLPPNSTSELVQYMKAKPGNVRYGSTGIGAVVHLGVAMFEGAAGVKGLHVPYSGSAPVYNDLLGGHVDFTEGGVPFPQGLKVLGPLGTKRHPAYPDLPTLDEIGIKNASWDLWYGLVAPPNLPKPIADRLIEELTAVMKDPEAIAKFTFTAKVAPDPLIGGAFKKAVLDENKQWKQVADREKIVMQP
jgi:tripartite-type tricarboxylate transporter receptor subunit TctC